VVGSADRAPHVAPAMKSPHQKSRVAALRRYPIARRPIGELESAMRDMRREFFRVGWLTGYRAGLRAANRRED